MVDLHEFLPPKISCKDLLIESIKLCCPPPHPSTSILICDVVLDDVVVDNFWRFFFSVHPVLGLCHNVINLYTWSCKISYSSGVYLTYEIILTLFYFYEISMNFLFLISMKAITSFINADTNYEIPL